MSYSIVIKEGAKKDLKRIPSKMQDKILDKIESLADDPKPFGIKKLKEFQLPNNPINEFYRIRVGDYRVIYTVQEDIITVTVVRVAHRKEVYD